MVFSFGPAILAEITPDAQRSAIVALNVAVSTCAGAIAPITLGAAACFFCFAALAASSAASAAFRSCSATSVGVAAGTLRPVPSLAAIWIP